MLIAEARSAHTPCAGFGRNRSKVLKAITSRREPWIGGDEEGGEEEAVHVPGREAVRSHVALGSRAAGRGSPVLWCRHD
jgi:hypothetical protein